MHEFSVVASLIENCEQIAAKNAAKKVLKVYVQIGDRSGVNAELLKTAFEDFKIGSICEEAELLVENSAVKLFCRLCNKSSKVFEVNYTQCPLCYSQDVSIIEGNEMLLMRLEME